MINANVDPCRVCLSEGTWNIFGSNAINDEMCTVASINHIRDKLQYVTQLEVKANDGLPFRICELCIVQLNLAYRFKQLAADSDSKLREQYYLRQAPTADLRNALVNVDNAIVQGDPEGISFLKQEQEPSICEVSAEPMVISEPCTEHYTPVSDARAFNGTPDPGTVRAMVYLQKDIINPAEDEAFLKDIIQKEVISMPWPIIADCTATDTSSPCPSERETPTKPPTPLMQGPLIDDCTATDTSNPQTSTKLLTPPKQTGARQKARKSPPKRRLSASEPEAQLDLENRLQRQHMLSKKKVKRSTVVPTPSGAVKEGSKSSKAAMRRRRLQKELENLRIDMVDDKLKEQRRELSTAHGPTILPMKRRNSICISSLQAWMY